MVGASEAKGLYGTKKAGDFLMIFRKRLSECDTLFAQSRQRPRTKPLSRI